MHNEALRSLLVVNGILLVWFSDVFSIPWSSVNAHEFTGQSLLDTTARHLASPQSHRRTVPSLEHADIIKQEQEYSRASAQRVQLENLSTSFYGWL